MRKIRLRERKKRGCEYCTEYVIINRYIQCKHNECPFHELDGHRTYGDYLKTCPEVDIMKLLQPERKYTKSNKKRDL
jgi:hypothetical protein